MVNNNSYIQLPVGDAFVRKYIWNSRVNGTN